MNADGRGVRRCPVGIVALVLALAGTVLLFGGCGGGDSDKDKGQTVRFQKPTDPGPDPFVKPADTSGAKTVKVGSGPYGGTGSDLVCDRELLIRSLIARPERLAEWARVLDVAPTARAVARYIRTLKAVTLTRDTRVTNHSFVDGSAVGYQAILQAGTAVLVNEHGVPVARCRCGNPLLKPVFVEVAKCYGCPPDYRPPPPCKYLDFKVEDFKRLSDVEFLVTFRRSAYRGTCYLPYPDPPPLKPRARKRKPPPQQPPPTAVPATTPAAFFSPAAGTATDTFTLVANGFEPNRTLTVSLTRPDGRVESYTIVTGSDGSGRKVFPRVDNPVLGTYSATITDPQSGDRASATVRVSPARTQQTPPSGGGLQCNPPRSQLEFEQCRDRDQGTQTTPQTQPTCPPDRLRNGRCVPECDPNTPVQPCISRVRPRSEALKP